MRSLLEPTTHVEKSNKIEEIEAGLEHDPEEFRTEDVDPAQNPLKARVVPVPKRMPATVMVEGIELAERAVKALGTGMPNRN